MEVYQRLSEFAHTQMEFGPGLFWCITIFLKLFDVCLFQCTGSLLLLIPKTVGYRKRDCAWWCSVVKKLKKNQLLSTNHQTHICFAWWWFVLNNWFYFNFLTPAHHHAQSLFLFPIVFGIKGSVERSLLPWAILLIFTRNRPWKSEDHLCTLFFIEMSEGKTRKKRKNTASFVASLGAGVQPRSTVRLFMPVSGVEKPPFSQFFFSALGAIWRGKAFRDQQWQFQTRNKSLSSENESNCSMTSECVRTDS